MQFRNVATLHELVDGDRFYFNGDGKKVKWVLIRTESRRTTRGYTYTSTIRPADWHDRMKYPEQPSKEDIQKPNAETIEVVFLRHKEAIA